MELFDALFGELQPVLDDETITLRDGDTIAVPPHVWHEAKSVYGGKMLTIFKNGEFGVFLEHLSTMNKNDFANAEVEKSVFTRYDYLRRMKLFSF